MGQARKLPFKRNRRERRCNRSESCDIKAIPYILEVDQPESKFIFRIGEERDGSPIFKLVEADGGIWKYAAVDRIKEFIRENLKPEFLDRITIIG